MAGIVPGMRVIQIIKSELSAWFVSVLNQAHKESSGLTKAIPLSEARITATFLPATDRLKKMQENSRKITNNSLIVISLNVTPWLLHL